jgi:hypothetical protein
MCQWFNAHNLLRLCTFFLLQHKVSIVRISTFEIEFGFRYGLWDLGINIHPKL